MSGIRRRLVALIMASTALAATGLTAAPLGVAAAAPRALSAAQLSRAGRTGLAKPIGRVDLKLARQSLAHSRLPVPSFSPRVGKGNQVKKAIAPSRARTLSIPHVSRQSQPLVSPGPIGLAGFDGTSYEQQVGAAGIDQGLAPPDTHVAAGATYLVETTNAMESIWTKTGTPVHTYDLNTLFPVPAQYQINDPWILYFGGRYYLSAWASDNHFNSQLYFAASAGDDPTVWTTYLVKANTSSLAYDQPKLAVSGYTGITLVWDDFDCAQATCPFTGEEIWVASPQTIPGNLATWSNGPDLNRFGGFPAQLPSGSMDGQLLVFNASDPNLFTVTNAPVLGIVGISGQPSNPGSMAVSTQLIQIPSTTIPPDASQGGGGRPISTGDDRVLSAFLENESLWIALNDGCTPSGDTAVRSCLRVIHVTINTSTVDQDFDFGQPGRDLYYPAVSRTIKPSSPGFSSYTVYLLYNGSSPQSSAGLFATTMGESPFSSLNGETPLRAGSGPYDCSFCGPANRWGDFSSAVRDPVDASDVWLGGEFAATATDRQNWATAIWRLTDSPPQVKTIAPILGPVGGGTSVTLTGSDFTSASLGFAFGATTVMFGSTPSTGVSVQSPNSLTAVSPSNNPGTVTVTASTVFGSSSSQSIQQPQFTYLIPPSVSNLSPSSGPGGTLVVINGVGLNNFSQVRFGTTPVFPSQFIGYSDTQMSLYAPAHGAGTVDVTVVTPGGVSATSPADQFTYPATQPTVAGLNPASGSSAGGNTVTISGSGLGATTSVQFGSQAAASFQMNGANSISAVSPPGSGTVDVTVTSGSLTSAISAGDRFTYVPISVTGIAPAAGTASGGTALTITGTGFDTGGAGYIPSISFGGTPVPLTVVSATQATVSTPAATYPRAVQPIVCTTVGCSAPGTTFTYQASASLSPASGPTAGGTAVTLSGTGLGGVKSVTFGSVPATFQVRSDSQIVATSPPQAGGAAMVTIALADATHPVSVGPFIYVAPTPAVSAVKPASGATWGGDAVTVTGSGFTWATSVMFGSVASPAFHVDSDTQITAIGPAQHAAVVDITVTTGGGRSALNAGDRFVYSDCVVPFATAGDYPFEGPCTAVSHFQYRLTGSDGVTWENLDVFDLSLMITPSVDSTYVLSGNADLWTANAGYNQDLGINVNGAIAAWKESGGFAGTFSPNAAYVQTVYPMTAGQTYVITLQWKTNKKDASGTIFAAAGLNPDFSPTRLTATLIPNPGSNFASVVSNSQYRLPGSDGKTWQDIDASLLKTTVTAPADGVMVLGGNADLWTVNAGYNQDLGINVNGALVGWKESGGFAGTFSPNAAFVQVVTPVSAGQSYTISLQWKTNRPDPKGLILAAAGLNPDFSPTRLTIEFRSAGVSDGVSTNQYRLSNSDGATWNNIDATLLMTQVTPATDCLALVSGNADLWTANAGFNQDLGIFVSGGSYGTGKLVAWKESGGYAGTFSPNAAFVQTVLPLAAGSTYTVSLQWKTNRADPGTIFAAAGLTPNFSPSRVTTQMLSCMP